MPCLVKSVGTVTCRFNLWLFSMSTHFLVHSTGEFWFINNLSKLSCMVQDFRDRLMPPNWSSRKPLFTTKNDFFFFETPIRLSCCKVTKFISSGFRVDRWRFRKIIIVSNYVTLLESYDGLKKCITCSGAPCTLLEIFFWFKSLIFIQFFVDIEIQSPTFFILTLTVFVLISNSSIRALDTKNVARISVNSKQVKVNRKTWTSLW